MRSEEIYLLPVANTPIPVAALNPRSYKILFSAAL